jgi:hypothetical protein
MGELLITIVNSFKASQARAWYFFIIPYSRHESVKDHFVLLLDRLVDIREL